MYGLMRKQVVGDIDLLRIIDGIPPREQHLACCLGEDSNDLLKVRGILYKYLHAEPAPLGI
jgi:hypothetical protein